MGGAVPGNALAQNTAWGGGPLDPRGAMERVVNSPFAKVMSSLTGANNAPMAETMAENPASLTDEVAEFEATPERAALFPGQQPAQGDGTGANIQPPDERKLRWRQGIKDIESSGGNYGIVGPATNGDRPYGAYQVMGANVGPWTQKYLGRRMTPDEFLRNPAAQDAVFDGEFGSYVQRFGEEGAAQAWFGGAGSVGKGDRKDVLGTSVSGYGKRFAQSMGGPEHGTRPVQPQQTYEQSMASRMFGGEMQPGQGEQRQKQLVAEGQQPAGGGGGSMSMSASQASEISSGGQAYDDSGEFLQQAAEQTKGRTQGTGARAQERKAALRQRIGGKA